MSRKHYEDGDWMRWCSSLLLKVNGRGRLVDYGWRAVGEDDRLWCWWNAGLRLALLDDGKPLPRSVPRTDRLVAFLPRSTGNEAQVLDAVQRAHVTAMGMRLEAMKAAQARSAYRDRKISP